MRNLTRGIQLFACLFFVGFYINTAHAAVDQEYKIVKLRSLDKITAHTMTFEAEVGSTVKFGSLFIKTQACRKSPPIETPEAAAFLQIWEVDKDEKPHWVFSGWMFASSPGLSSMDHPIYDVWVIDCLEEKTQNSGVSTSADMSKKDEEGLGNNTIIEKSEEDTDEDSENLDDPDDAKKDVDPVEDH